MDARVESRTGRAAPAPLAVTQVQRLLQGPTGWGARTVTLLDESGRVIASVGSEPGAPSGLPGAASPVPDVTVRAPVTVGDTVVAEVCAAGPAAAAPSFEPAAHVTAARLADAWEAAQELDSLSGALVQSYEELHLLYELGEALTGQLSTASAADLILQTVMDSLPAAWVELQITTPHLGDAGTVVYQGHRRSVASPAAPSPDLPFGPPPVPGAGQEARDRQSGTRTAGGESSWLAETGRRLEATLRSGGKVVGKLVVLRSRDDPPFTSADGKLLDAVGTLAAQALRTTQLHEAVHRQAEAALHEREAEAAALREIDRIKDELLLTISHELRTPVTVVHGYAQLLLARASELDAAGVAQMAERILANSSQLARLAADLADFRSIEHGEVELQPGDIDLAPVLREAVAGFQRRADGNRLVAELPDRLPIRADSVRVAQAVSNLLDNAMKYAPAGPIMLRAWVANGILRLEVEDHGPGISPKEQPRVWEKFFRGAGVAGLNVSRGSGIGLALVKALIEAHGGRVGLHSTLGVGSRFWFELPAPNAAQRSLLPTKASQLQGPDGSE